ncbi:MAG: S8 family serine peptidase, partial [candidate division WOR-3 bacterium]
VAAARAVERGLIVVTAMGNRADTLTPGEERWPRPFVVAPGDAFNVITVGGVEKSRRPWNTPGGGGTGCGPTPDGRHKPDLVAMGDSVTVVAPDSAGNVYEGSSGTSGATALIAGCCALVREAHPERSAIQVRDSLLKYADRHAAPDDTFGHGIPDVYALLRNNPPAIKTLQGDEIGTIYPNPFRPGDGVRVYFPLLLLQPASFVTLSIFTLSGELVHSDTLKSSAQGFLGAPGRYADRAYLDRIGAYWDGKNNQGKLCAAGMYYAALQTGSGRAVRAFCLVR